MAINIGTAKTPKQILDDLTPELEAIIEEAIKDLNLPARSAGGDTPILRDYVARLKEAVKQVPVRVLADQTAPVPGAPAPDPAVPTAPATTPTGTAPLPPPPLPARPAATGGGLSFRIRKPRAAAPTPTT